ncbi:MAG: winged helix-turn-helix transcriptional regulator [Halobacteriovoraceae bacterium]|jgi:DNA-binding transcriptional ArsR family regulator|nr:winged helix-turn-helix transcriptional regulator [Halobacteriovoraceae bacterium]
MAKIEEYIDFEKQAEIFKALGHPTRLLLSYNLRKKELCVSELNKLIDIDQSTLSRHLKILKIAGVLKNQKKSMQVYYSLRVPCLLDNILECINKL